jgi:hypothetical protein
MTGGKRSIEGQKGQPTLSSPHASLPPTRA